jgi:hypothetical protein
VGAIVKRIDAKALRVDQIVPRGEIGAAVVG